MKFIGMLLRQLFQPRRIVQDDARIQYQKQHIARFRIPIPDGLLNVYKVQ